MNRFFTGIFTFLVSTISFAQTDNSPREELHTKSKLVVGVVVDQMRYDYLTRFWERFGDNGFKRLVSDGFNFKNAHFNYIPTYTGPGHASVFTGATPESHGIVGNNWYDKFDRKEVYCTGDPEVSPVGTSSSAGKMSPHRMLTTSIADENRLHTQFKGKTIGIALKDRGAILPAGHTANAAYWFHGQDEGVWITSSFYRKELPQWVRDFNTSGKAASYFKTWNTLYDIETYTESGVDRNVFEGGFKGRETATFPYDLKRLRSQNDDFELVKITPFGNSLTTDFAIAAIDGEELGQDDITDFLTLSFSSTDYVGHNFGVNSIEVQDAYLRLDKELERLLNALDEKVGEGNYTLFLTADHGGVHVPSYLQTVRIPSGYFDVKTFIASLNEFVLNQFGVEQSILNVSNNQIFFNYDKLLGEGIELAEFERAVSHYCLQYEQVNKVFTRTQLEGTSYTRGLDALVDMGYHQKRSGDVVLLLEPSVIVYSLTGSTHGSGHTYDTHAPMLFYGNGIKRGSTVERAEITDIAPTIAALLGIPFPNGATGKPLEVVFQD